MADPCLAPLSLTKQRCNIAAGAAIVGLSTTIGWQAILDVVRQLSRWFGLVYRWLGEASGVKAGLALVHGAAKGGNC